MKNVLFLILATLAWPLWMNGQQDGAVQRIRFTLSNPSLKTQKVDIRHFNTETQQQSGYGYELGALGAHPVNMPAGTRVYRRTNGNWNLAFVVTTADDGRKFDLSRTYEISREQWLQASWDELYEKNNALEKAYDDTDIASMARRQGIRMINFVIAGKTLWDRQVYVKTLLPFDNQNGQTGFSRPLNVFSRLRVSYPEGTKIYLCNGPYWTDKQVKEQLLLTVDVEKSNYLIRM